MAVETPFKNEDVALKYLNIKTDRYHYEQNSDLQKNPVRKSFEVCKQFLRKTGWLYIGHFPCQLLPMLDSGFVYLGFNLILLVVVYASVKYAISLINLFM